MPKTTIIAVDTGNRYIKTEHFNFTSGIVSHGTVPPAVGTVDTIKYDGRYYSLTNARDAYRRDKTTDENYYILTMAAVAKELIETGDYTPGETVNEHVTLAMGLPVAHLQKMRDKYAAYFAKDGSKMEFEYNAQKFNIIIDAVHVWPQGYAAAVVDKDFNKFADFQRAYIIDIGGYTTDVCVFHNGASDMSYVESINMGAIHLNNKVIAAIQQEVGVELDDIAVEALIRKDPKIKNEELFRVTDEAKQVYSDELMRKLTEKGIDFVTSCLIFMGGGSLLLKDTIQKFVKHDMLFFIEDVNANAIGYNKLSRAMVKKMNAAGGER